MKKGIVVLFIMCLIYFTVINPFRVNASTSVLLKLDGKSRQATTEKSITYKILPTESSIVKIKVVYKSSSPVTATLTNRSTNINKKIESSYINGTATIDFSFYAEAVEYELTLEFENGNSTTKYSIVGQSTKLTQHEGKENDSLDKSILMSTPDQLLGVLGFGDTMDCYMISMNSEGTLKINFLNQGPESINFKIYDTYKNLIKIETVAHSSSANIELSKANGNYYLSIDPVYTNGFGTNYKLTIGDYVALSALKFSKKQVTLTEGSSKTIKASITPSNANEKFTYKSSDKKIAKVDSTGKITAVKPGKVTITAYSLNNSIKTSFQLTVKAKTVTKVSLNVSKKSLEVNKTFQIKPSVSPKGTKTTYKFTSSNPKVAKVDKQGKVTAISKGSCIITVTSNNGKKATCKVTVTPKPTPIVTPTPKPQPTQKPVPTPTPDATIDVTAVKASSNMILLKVGDKETIEYTILPENATDKSIIFNSLNEKVVTVDKKGVVTAVSPGTTYVNGTTKNGKTIMVTIIVIEKLK